MKRPPTGATAVALSCSLLAVSACRERGAASAGPDASASAVASADVATGEAGASPSATARRRAFDDAEQRRDSRIIGDEDLASRDVVVRRRAVRALARIGDDRAADLLLRALGDEDFEVVRWAAYGTGYACKGREPKSVRTLTVRAASLIADGEKPPAVAAALDAMADALARCGTPEAERTLRAWLDTDGARAESAALALGRLASRQKRLDDASVVALLDVASRPEPLSTALFAFTRFSPEAPSARQRLLEVAQAALAKPGRARAFAIRALGRAGSDAAGALTSVLSGDTFAAPERADAARELGRLGDAGQRKLSEALPELAKLTEGDAAGKLMSASFAPLMVSLETLTAPGPSARRTLSAVAQLAVPLGATPALTRRVVALRCRAASLLADADLKAAPLVACDPEKDGRSGLLARLRVLDRAAITGTRGRQWRGLAASKDRVVREAALELISGHPELAATAPVLADALLATEEGVVATAAQLLATYPDRADAHATVHHDRPVPIALAAPSATPQAAPPLVPDPRVSAALAQALEVQRSPDAVETLVALFDAAAALGLTSAKARFEAGCSSEWPALREHAEKALRALGDVKRRCGAPPAGSTSPAELGGALSGRLKLRLETDAGALTLTLDADLAPIAVTRVVELAKAGFYDGNVVHRVVPGFVAQFGDPGGDGFGGPGRAPLRCETSPESFAPRTVGVALAGRDTGGSQLFVTLGEHPHLDGDYALIGFAEGPWDALVVGDVIRTMRVQ